MKIKPHIFRACLVLALALAVSSCRTLEYREVQSDFERAVEAETARAESPFVDWYQGVASTLTEDYIGKLDEKLRPNAWMLRGMAEWRSENYSNANSSAAKGSREIERQGATSPNLSSSRDGILLTLLPGLVQDSQLRDRLQTAGTNFTGSGYETNFLPQFKAVLRQFGEAKKDFAAPTPSAVKHYWHYHLWRVLQNWSFTLGRLPLGEDASTAAYDAADKIIASQFSALTSGTNLPTAITAAKAAIPEDHPYRRLIAIEEKR